MRAFIRVVAVVVVCILAPVGVLGQEFIEDENFRRAFESETGSSPDDLDALRSATELRVDRSGIGSIAGIEHMRALRELDLSFNPIESIEPLSGLPRLYHLDLGSVTLTDIAPLVTLPDLRTLYLSDWRVQFSQEQVEWYLALGEVDFFLTESGFIRYVGDAVRPQITDLPSNREVVDSDLARLFDSTDRVFDWDADDVDWTIEHNGVQTVASVSYDSWNSEASLSWANRIAEVGTDVLQAANAYEVVEIAGGCSRYMAVAFEGGLEISTWFGPIGVTYDPATGAPHSVSVYDDTTSWSLNGIRNGSSADELMTTFGDRNALRSGEPWDPAMEDVLFVSVPDADADAFIRSGDIETRIWFEDGVVSAMTHSAR